MGLRDQYDWIILGDHPGALLCAGIAANLGQSVLVIPVSAGEGLKISTSGQCVDSESGFLLGLSRKEDFKGIVADCLETIGAKSTELNRMDSHPQLPQILTPTKRVSLFQEEDAFLAELEREFSQKFLKKFNLMNSLHRSQSLFSAYWRKLPVRLTLPSEKNSKRKPEVSKLEDLREKILGRGSLQEDLFTFFKSDPEGMQFVDVAKGWWFAFAGFEKDSFSLFDFLHILFLGKVGARFPGGMTAYRKFLLDLAKRLGAHRIEPQKSLKILVEGGRFQGVQLGQDGNKISGGAGVLGSSLNQINGMIYQGKRSWYSHLKKGLLPQGWIFTLSLTVKEQGIPPGFSSRMIWQEEGSPPVEIESVKPAEYGLTEKDCRLLFLRTPLPFRDDSITVEFQKLISTRMLRLLFDQAPFLETHIVRMYPDLRQEMKAHKFDPEGVYRFPSLESIPDYLKIYDSKGLGIQSGFESLYLVSGESYPEFGSLGATQAALEVVATVAHRSGIPGPFGKLD